MKMKKILCVLISVLMLLTLIVYSAGARTVIELTEEEIESGKSIVWDWYGQGEPMMRWKLARARALNPDGWKAIEDDFVYASNGQFANGNNNLERMFRFFDDTAEMDDPSFVFGDFNKNGIIDVGDARIVLRIAIGLEKLPENSKLEEYDVSINEKIGVEDARLVLRATVGLDLPHGLDLTFK